MNTDHLNVTFECKQCGGTILELPDDPTDESIVKCKSCGIEFGRWGDIKAKARDLGADHLRGMVRDTFKGLKGWKMK